MTVPSELKHAPQVSERDTLFADKTLNPGGFVFDRAVVDVFPDMIERSVPGYATILHMIGYLANRYAQPATRIYDLGCSLGAASLAILRQVRESHIELVAVDNSPAMIERCRELFEKFASHTPTNSPIQLLLENIQSVEVESASVVVLNFTLQFIPLEQRLELMQKIYAGMCTNGILILSEKLDFDDRDHTELMTELHHHFKENNGYSKSEIAGKRAALENVLVPETLKAHQERLESVGFTRVDLWFQCFNFASLIAFK